MVDALAPEDCQDCIHKNVCRKPVNLYRECRFKISVNDRELVKKCVEQMTQSKN